MIQKLLETAKRKLAETANDVRNKASSTIETVKQSAKQQLRMSLDLNGREIKKGQVYEITVGTTPGLLKITSTPADINGKIEYVLKAVNLNGETVMTKHSDYVQRFQAILDSKNFAEHDVRVHEQQDGFTIAGIDFKVGDFFEDNGGIYYIKSFTVDPVKGLRIKGIDYRGTVELDFRSSMLDYDSKRDKFRKITDEKFIQDSMVKIQAKLDFDKKYRTVN